MFTDNQHPPVPTVKLLSDAFFWIFLSTLTAVPAVAGSHNPDTPPTPCASETYQIHQCAIINNEDPEEDDDVEKSYTQKPPDLQTPEGNRKKSGVTEQAITPITPARAPASIVRSNRFEVLASRSFLYRHTFPPEDYAAYGIVAFPITATSASRSRYEMICEAYVAALPDTALLDLPADDQMVTVWPVDDENVADQLQEASLMPGNFSSCDQAVTHYDIITARRSIGHASSAGLDLENKRGPFLLAWSPSSSKGDPDAVVLYADLSRYNSQASINSIFMNWATDIESNPDLWRGGWSIDGIQVVIRNWADNFGEALLGLFRRG